MKGLLLPLLAALALPTPVNAFWGLSEEEKTICRDRASKERNEFSAKQTYNYCSKNIKSELKEKERKAKEREINYQRWYEEVGKDKEKECKRKKLAYEQAKKDASIALTKMRSQRQESIEKKAPVDKKECKKLKGIYKIYCRYDPSSLNTAGAEMEIAKMSMTMCRTLLLESKRKYGL